MGRSPKQDAVATSWLFNRSAIVNRSHNGNPSMDLTGRARAAVNLPIVANARMEKSASQAIAIRAGDETQVQLHRMTAAVEQQVSLFYWPPDLFSASATSVLK